MTEGGRRPLDSRWIVLRTAPSQLVAELWRELLQSEGVPATLAPEDAVSFLGLSPGPCRLLVPAEARDLAERALAGVLWRLQTDTDR